MILFTFGELLVMFYSHLINKRTKLLFTITLLKILTFHQQILKRIFYQTEEICFDFVQVWNLPKM